MTDKQNLGRPMAARDLHVVPELREDPDVAKLARALITITKKLAEQKKAEEQALSSNGEGDAMP